MSCPYGSVETAGLCGFSLVSSLLVALPFWEEELVASVWLREQDAAPVADAEAELVLGAAVAAADAGRVFVQRAEAVAVAGAALPAVPVAAVAAAGAGRAALRGSACGCRIACAPGRSGYGQQVAAPGADGWCCVPELWRCDLLALVAWRTAGTHSGVLRWDAH